MSVLPVLDLDSILGGNLSTVVDGSLFWSEGTNPDADPEYTPNSLSPTGCDPETVTINAYVQCSSGGDLSWVLVANHNFEFYPVLESPTIAAPTVNADGSCNYIVTAACPADVLDINDLSFLSGTDAGTETITVSNPNNPCSAMTFDLPYDACASVDCFSSSFINPATDVLCAGDLSLIHI